MKPTAVSADVLFEAFRASLRWEWVAGLGASERRFDEVAIDAWVIAAERDCRPGDRCAAEERREPGRDECDHHDRGTCRRMNLHAMPRICHGDSRQHASQRRWRRPRCLLRAVAAHE